MNISYCATEKELCCAKIIAQTTKEMRRMLKKCLSIMDNTSHPMHTKDIVCIIIICWMYRAGCFSRSFSTFQKRERNWIFNFLSLLSLTLSADGINIVINTVTSCHLHCYSHLWDTIHIFIYNQTFLFYFFPFQLHWTFEHQFLSDSFFKIITL